MLNAKILKENSNNANIYFICDYLEYQKLGGNLDIEKMYSKWNGITGLDFYNLKEGDYIFLSDGTRIQLDTDVMLVEDNEFGEDDYWKLIIDDVGNFLEGEIYSKNEKFDI